MWPLQSAQMFEIVSWVEIETAPLPANALYYFPPERNHAFDFLGGAETLLRISGVAETTDTSMSRLLGLLNAGGIRIAIADLTALGLKATPFRVARALGTDIQQIH